MHRPKEKPYKLTDSHGLYLVVTPSRGRLWRYRYRFAGTVKDLSLGTFPEVTLAQAREKRDTARQQIKNSIDPCKLKQAQKSLTISKASDGQETFETIAREWHGQWSHDKAKSTAQTTIRRLEKNVFPWMGARPVVEIDAPELLAVLRRIESRGILESTRRIKIICAQVFRYAVSTGRAKQDPSASISKDVLKTPVGKHMASITNPEDIPSLLRAIDNYSG